MGMLHSGSVQSALLDPPLRCGLTSVQQGYSLVADPVETVSIQSRRGTRFSEHLCVCARMRVCVYMPSAFMCILCDCTFEVCL